MTDDGQDLLRTLAVRVAEGEAVDWDAEEQRASGPEERKLVRALRAIQELAAIPPRSQTVSGSETGSRSGLEIGRYRLAKKLGEGGMGEVWEAEQREPVRRRVALKIIKHGMDTGRFVARFEAERQALAMMEHPSIARVLDAGTTERGRPYFVMELVRGVPITEHCDRARLTTRNRLQLFMQVCEAVQHAHQKAVIHRDIKPSNVLVAVHEGKAVPKIIDFGVAKTLAKPLTERTLFTEVGQLVGTPAYMSPEQADLTELKIDTRTDVYSLGVLLYDLLVGTPPFDPRELRQAAFDEICRRIREDDPPKPSTRADSLDRETATESARNRGTEPATLRRQLRGELDWITMKALEKDRARRYDSPAELAADLGRYLGDEPVTAGPPGVVYRARKFARRHRLGVGLAAVSLVAVVAFAVTVSVQARRIARERDRANQEAATSDRIADFMSGVFEVSNPWQTKGEAVTAQKLLDGAIDRIEDELAEEPAVQARLLFSMGRAYWGLGLFDRAEAVLTKSSRLRRAALGAEHPDTLETDQWLAIVLMRLGRFAESESLTREVLERQERILGHGHADTVRTLNNLGMVFWRRARYAEAAEVFEDVLRRASESLGPEHRTTLAVTMNLAVQHKNLGRLKQAERLQRDNLEIERRVLGEDDPTTLEGMHVLGAILEDMGRYEEAEAMLRDAVKRFETVLGNDHFRTVATANDLGDVLFSQGRHMEAEALFRRALRSYGDALGAEHPRTLLAKYRVARAALALGRSGEAETLAREARDVQRRVQGDEHLNTLLSTRLLARIYTTMGETERARSLEEQVLVNRRRRAADPHASPAAKNQYAAALLACEYTDLCNPAEALRFAKEAAELTDFENANVLDTLAQAYHRNGRSAEAIETAEAALALLPGSALAQRQAYGRRLAEYGAASR